MTVRDYRTLYGNYHRVNKSLSGFSTAKLFKEIRGLIELVKPERILDYGCGKGHQYLCQRLHEEWGGLLPYCYDPGIPNFSKKPEGLFGGVICCDVMEHIDEQDVDEILEDIFISLHQDRMTFAAFLIDTHPAKKVFRETGENFHLTIKPIEWWEAKLNRFRRDNLVLVTKY